MTRAKLFLLIVAALACLARIRVTVTPPGTSFSGLAALVGIVALVTVAGAAVITVRLLGEWRTA